MTRLVAGAGLSFEVGMLAAGSLYFAHTLMSPGRDGTGVWRLGIRMSTPELSAER